MNTTTVSAQILSRISHLIKSEAMKRINSTALILSASVLLLTSCGKEVIPGRGNAPAIKLTVKGIYNTKSSETVLSDLQSDGFNISAYVTETWKRDVVGNSPDIRPGIYVDPGFYEGLYDETSFQVLATGSRTFLSPMTAAAITKHGESQAMTVRTTPATSSHG